MRIGLPLCGVGLIIGFLLGIAVYADSANRAGVLGLSDTLLRSTQERIALQVSAYLEPAAHATLLAHSMLGRGAATDHADQAYGFAVSVLNETPQVANVLFADAAGSFMLVTRAANGPRGATETKRILVAGDGRTVSWISRDSAGKVTGQREDPADQYDARTRSWFTGARAADDVFWSRVYIFFTERAPGVTAAVHGPGEDPDVVGVDLRLDAISHFLGGLSIGQTGRAYIASRDGEMIAGPDPARVMRIEDGKPAPARIDAVGDADLVASWDHYRTGGPGNRIIEAGGRRLISIVTPLENTGQDWLLFITVPEVEFSGFVTANSRRAALLSLVVVALALGLAALLVRQNLRAGRAARAVAERSAAVRQQSAAFARLASEAGMFDNAGAPPTALTETLAEATGARRAGVWRLASQGQILRCDDSFEPATGGHIGGLELSRQEAPALFEAIAKGEPIDASDARRDRRTAPLHGSLMAPFGTTGVYAVPVTQAGRAIGLVILEDPRRDPAAADFARACATLVSLATVEAVAVAVDASSTAGSFAAEPPADALRLDPALAPFDPTPAAPPLGPTPSDGTPVAATPVGPTQVGPTPVSSTPVGPAGRQQAVVLVLTLPDTAAAQAHRIACAAQEITLGHGIPYTKMLGTTIVAAAGYMTNLKDAASRLADAAITLRERCIDLLASDDGPAAFGIGLDAGPVSGATLGEAPGLFNLWGDAVKGATALAESAPAETIQASEQAYLLLRQGFVFRPRGLFYRPQTGEARSFVLAGRT